MNNIKLMRQAVESSLDALEMLAFNQGFEAALNGIEEISDAQHYSGNTETADVLMWLSKELRGENA